jgi:two-component system, chemotaxis family, CheB/CheR fusion protein
MPSKKKENKEKADKETFKKAAANKKTGNEEIENEAKAARRRRAKPFPIVAIGASAGGLEAFSELLKALPGNTGMAYIYVQHLDPKHKSMLSEILSKSTAMPIGEVEDGMVVEPDHVYVKPPNTEMGIFHGALFLMPRTEPPQQHKPIDYFLRSLAEDRKNLAIGIILSGTATDGSLGVKAIKEEGGITVAQDYETAKYDGMPRSAVATGYIDLVLPPLKIAEELANIGKHPYLARDLIKGEKALVAEEEETFRKIFAILRTSTGVDFTDYKQSTIKRRMARRMVLHRIQNPEDYLRFIQGEAGEVESLFRDLLITVTSFFRIPEQFDALKKTVFPEILAGKTRQRPVRIWVPGCATGEEAYSIALALQEFMEKEKARMPELNIQIFATDVSEENIAKARAGIYLESIADDVSPQRLQRFFNRREDGFEIKKYIRDTCIFAIHDITRDPPFSQIDLISCRNLLIYLGLVLQQRIMPLLHYALKPNGFLILGISESIGRFADLFGLVDSKNKIYSKKTTAVNLPLDFTFPNRAWEVAVPLAEEPLRVLPKADPIQEAKRIMLDRYAPLGVLVDEDMNILNIQGLSDNFLEIPEGRASLNIFKMARDNLEYELRALIQKSSKSRKPVRKEGIRLQRPKQVESLNIEIVPIASSCLEGGHFLILFEAAPKPAAPGKKKETPGKIKPSGEGKDTREVRIGALEGELAEAREYVRGTIEEHEAVVEELKAANEEIMSANEELQSTSEEMETAKEELQSSNEELTTLNEELGARNSELRLVNDDLLNVFSAIDIPVIITGGDLLVRRYTAPAQEIFHIKPSDIGRSLQEIKPKIDLPDLKEKALEVMQTLVTQKLEIEDDRGRWYALNMRPYRTTENKIDGVVISFADITAFKAELAYLRDYYEPVLDTVREPLIILDEQLRVVRANRSFYRVFQVSPEDTEGRRIYDLGDRQWNIPSLRKLLEEIIPENASFDDFEVEHDFKSIGKKTMLLNAKRIERKTGAEPLILLAIEDITGQSKGG